MVPGAVTNWAPDHLTVTNCWIGLGPDAFRLRVTNDVTVGAGGTLCLALSNTEFSCGGNLMLTNGGSLVLTAGSTNGVAGDFGALVSVTGEVVVSAASWIYVVAPETNGGAVLFRVGNLRVAANGGLSADARGFAGGNKVETQWTGFGPGGGASIPDGRGAGGGYGGRGGDNSGGASGGGTYGLSNAPVQSGSGGGTGNSSPYTAGHGGGVLRVEATGMVSVLGTLTAGGEAGIGTHSGGGSGGSLFIHCSRFSGSTSGGH